MFVTTKLKVPPSRVTREYETGCSSFVMLFLWVSYTTPGAARFILSKYFGRSKALLWNNHRLFELL